MIVMFGRVLSILPLFCWNFCTVFGFSLNNIIQRYIPKPSFANGIHSLKTVPLSQQSGLKYQIGYNEEESEDEEDKLGQLDWRAFRAQLVMNESGYNLAYKCQSRLSEHSTWAYNQDQVIEKGSIILSGVKQEYGFGLRQQYFHKSVLMVLKHNSSFTKAIILNRPTSSSVADKNGNNWNIWFGGGSQNLQSPVPEITCLHVIEKGNKKVDEVSSTVLDCIRMCTFEDAKALVSENHAKVSQFWCLAGSTVWVNGRLEREIQTGSWMMCATDKNTIVHHLSCLSEAANTDDGLDMWEMLMSMIGEGDTVLEYSESFEDLMLVEWVRDNAADDSDQTKVIAEDIEVPEDGVRVGSLLRGPSNERSPYLLNNQILHKSLVLLILDRNEVSVGVILNQPSTQEVELKLQNPKTGQGYIERVPIRFGGAHAQGPIIWMHCNPNLREALIGTPVGPVDGFWKCSQDDVINAINCGLARSEDFLAVCGISIWVKDQKNISKTGIEGEVRNGMLERTNLSEISRVFTSLKSQKVLSWINLFHNLRQGNEAWRRAGETIEYNDITSNMGGKTLPLARLSDDALRTWVATFLLGSPSLGA